MKSNYEFLLEALGYQLTHYFEFYGTEEDLELARKCVLKIRSLGDSDLIAQAWFQGMNPALGNRSPARIVVTHEITQEYKWKLLLGAIDTLN